MNSLGVFKLVIFLVRLFLSEQRLFVLLSNLRSHLNLFRKVILGISDFHRPLHASFVLDILRIQRSINVVHHINYVLNIFESDNIIVKKNFLELFLFDLL